MGTRKKLVLTAIVSVSMALAFAMAFVPVHNLPGAKASSDGRVDMVDLLNMILGLDKQALTSVTVEVPGPSTRLIIPDASVEQLLLPVSASTAGAATDVTFVIDGVFTGADGWNSGGGAGVASPTTTDGPPYSTFIDLKGLSSIFGTHMLYALARDGSAPITVAELNYGTNGSALVGLSNKVNIVVVAPTPGADSDGDGIPDNPFSELGPGDVWTTLVSVPVLDAGGNIINVFRRVLVADLDVAGVKATGDAGVPLSITDPNTGVTAQVNTPTLDQLRGTGTGTLIDSATDAVAVLLMSTEPRALITESPLPMGAVDPSTVEPGPRVTPAEFVEVSIIYSNDGGATVADEVTELPGTLVVRLRMDTLNLDPNTGANFHSFSTSATGFPVAINADATATQWDPRFNTAVVAAGTLQADFATLSIFGAFSSSIRLYSVLPNFGPLGGGNLAAIDGDFSPTITLAAAQAAYNVYFGGLLAALSGIVKGVGNDLEVTVPNPGVATTTVVDVRVENAAAPSDFGQLPSAYTYQAPPVITALVPNSGNVGGGDAVVVQGLDFSNLVSVTFDGTVATVSGSTDTTIDVSTPPAPGGIPGTADVVVTTGIGSSAPATFTYGLAPAVTSVTPDTGPTTGGIDVVIAGSNLTNTTSVLFDMASATNIRIDSDTQLTVTIPAHVAGLVDVTVNATTGSDTLVGGFTYVSATNPVLTSLSPTTGPIGGLTRVTILGVNLSGVTSVTFDTTSVAPDRIVSDTEIEVLTPPHLAATVNVTATNASGASNALTFTYDLFAVAITGITPDNAWAFGTVVAQVTGLGFGDGTKATPVVEFGGVAGTVIAYDDQTISVLVPQNATLLAGGTELAAVAVTVSQNGFTDTLKGTTGFTYFRYVKSGNVTTTALVMNSVAGDTDTFLLDTVAATGSLPSATLTVPAFATGTVPIEILVLARASMTAGDFGLDAVSFTTGSLVTNAWNFDLHFYGADPVVMGFNTASGTALFSEISVTFPNTSQASVTLPTTGTNLTTTDVNDGRAALYSITSSLLQSSPSATPVEAFGGTAEYQSMVLTDEFTDDGAGNVTQVTTRLSTLSAYTLRRDVVLDLSTFGVTLSPASGPDAGGTSVTFTSAEGGLGAVSSVTFGGSSATITSPKGAAPDEFTVVARTPAGAGTVDVSVFLRSSPTAPALTLTAAYTYTGGIPPLLLLAALIAALALIAGGNSGGGGGGPCFIATAAYGTPMAAELDTLRAVRDSYLLDSAIGTAFVDTYYRVSPAIADVVAQSPLLASLVRVLLTPVVFGSNLLLAMPKVTAVLMVLMGAAMVMVRRRRRKA